MCKRPKLNTQQSEVSMMRKMMITSIVAVTASLLFASMAMAGVGFMGELPKDKASLGCAACHTAAYPELNDAGKAFKANGNKWPAAKPAAPAKAAEPKASVPAKTSTPVTKSTAILVNGVRQQVTVRVVDGKLMVPARTAAQWFGAVVDWNNQTKTATFTVDSHQVSFNTRTGKAVANGREIAVKSQLISNRTWVPAAFLAESLGAKVEYSEAQGLLIKLPVNHAAFLQGPFASGPDVTKACLNCHNQQAEHVLLSGHWTWQGPASDVAGREQVVAGKANGINNFCISIVANEARCTSCHAGYGWDGKGSFDFSDKTKIDCLVCHDSTGTYKKTPAGAGNPDPKVDLVKVAQNVGAPSRFNCGTCHFYAGGGDGVKNPGLDSTMANPTRNHDVHMGGADMACQDCHKTKDHQIPGGSLHVIPTYAGRVACEDCHGTKPHKTNETLNKHTAAVACQTCHIPTFATGQATKMYWDWSTAGKDGPEQKDQYGKEAYSKMKGSFIWEKDVRPVYAWYNGKSERYLLGDPVNKGGVTELARPVGNIGDPQAKIYPFKLFGGKQISDAVYGYLLTPHLFGGYWKHYDWDRAVRDGTAKSGLAYSGSYEFVETVMYMAVNHEVVPREQALKCADCHSAQGVMDFKALGYPGDPMRVGGRKVK